MHRGRRWLGRISRALFAPPNDAPRWLAWLVVAGLYLAGVAHWLFFFLTSADSFAFHVQHFDAYQWPREFVHLSLLQEAVQTATIPYHVSAPLKGTTRFLGIPDFLLSPQLLLLGVTSLPTFVLANTVLLYSVSFLSCLLARHRYRLSLFSFTVLVLLVTFNGNVTAQLGAGHYVWLGFFWLPLYGLLVLELLERPPSRTFPIKLALVLGVMMLQGTYHFYVWGVLFALLLMAFNPPLRRPLAGALALSVPLVAIRLFPPALTFWGASRGFLSGYPTLDTLLAGLAIVRTHATPPLGLLTRLRWWEYDVYVGLIGLAFLVYFGVVQRLRPHPRVAGLRYPALDGPLLVMGALSLSLWYAPLTLLPLPLVGAERVTTRFLLVPLVLLTLVAVRRMDRLLPAWVKHPAARAAALFALGQGAMALAYHSSLWRPAVLEAEAPLRVSLATLAATYRVASVPDPLYVALVNGSALLSLGTLLGLLAAWWRWRGQ